jgi:hypothetical protein
MANGQLGNVLRHIRRLIGAPLPIKLSFKLSRGQTLTKLSQNSLGFGIDRSEEGRTASACRQVGGI